VDLVLINHDNLWLNGPPWSKTFTWPFLVFRERVTFLLNNPIDVITDEQYNEQNIFTKLNAQ